MMFGAPYAPLSVHLPHQPLTPVRDYLAYFGCRPYFAQPVAGFTFRTADLDRPLHRAPHHEDHAHRVMVRYLSGITAESPGLAASVRAMARQLLPTGTVSLELIAGELGLHPKALHRRLAARADHVRRRGRRRSSGHGRPLSAGHRHQPVAPDPRARVRRAECAQPLVPALVRLQREQLPQGGARRDPRGGRLGDRGSLTVVACFTRLRRPPGPTRLACDVRP